MPRRLASFCFLCGGGCVYRWIKPSCAAAFGYKTAQRHSDGSHRSIATTLRSRREKHCSLRLEEVTSSSWVKSRVDYAEGTQSTLLHLYGLVRKKNATAELPAALQIALIENCRSDRIIRFITSEPYSFIMVSSASHDSELATKKEWKGNK